MNLKELLDNVVVQEALLKQRSSKVEYETYLKHNGWKVIGAGSYGTVFGRPNKNYVLKVYDDAGYDTFLKFLEKNNSSHLVKIKRKIIKSGSGDFIGVVAMEKLKPITGFTYGWITSLLMEFADTLNRKTHTNDTFEDVLEIFKKNYVKIYTPENDLYKNRIKTGQRSTAYNQRIYRNTRRGVDRIDFFLENYLPVAKTLYDILIYTKRHNLDAYFDLHLGNFMIRPSTDEIVITDPLV